MDFVAVCFVVLSIVDAQDWGLRNPATGASLASHRNYDSLGGGWEEKGRNADKNTQLTVAIDKVRANKDHRPTTLTVCR